MKLSELQRKDIINLNTGKKIGRIIDIEINKENGQLIKMIIETNKLFKGMFNNEKDISIKYDQINKIGEDVILVDIT